MSVGQSAGKMLGEAEQQALVMNFQGQTGTPLTRIEGEYLLKYLIAENPNPSLSTVAHPQTQSSEASASPIAPPTAPLPVRAVAQPKTPKLSRIGN